MLLKTLIPSAKQWRSWSLPAKASYLGCILGIPSLAIGALLPLLSSETPDRPAGNRNVVFGEVSSSAVLQGVAARDISITVVQESSEPLSVNRSDSLDLFVNGTTVPTPDRSVITLKSEREVQIRVFNRSMESVRSLSVSAFIPVGPESLSATGWTIQAPPINPTTGKEIPEFLHLWVEAAGLIGGQSWFRAPNFMFSSTSPKPLFTRSELEALGFQFTGEASNAPNDFVFHVLPIIISINGENIPSKRFTFFLTY